MKPIAVDTNLLLLLTVGQVARNYVEVHKRLRRYKVSDYRLLLDQLDGFSELVLLTHSLAEVSNMLGQGVRAPLHGLLFLRLREIISNCSEIAVPSQTAADHEAYLRLGLTDAAWLCLLDKGAALLTDDQELFHAALGNNCEAILFDSLR